MITIKTSQEIQIMKEGGWLLGKILQEVAEKVKPDVTTAQLNKVAQDLVFACGAKPAFLGYQGFPATLCTSINEEVVHGAPSERKMHEGDIIGLDLGILYPFGKCDYCPMGATCNPENQPFYTDMAVTEAVGKISKEAEKIIQAAKKALDLAIEKIKPGVHLGDVSFAIQKYVESEGFSVIRQLVGHGVGKELHEDPEVPKDQKTKLVIDGKLKIINRETREPHEKEDNNNCYNTPVLYKLLKTNQVLLHPSFL